jgi:hypothetical protein
VSLSLHTRTTLRVISDDGDKANNSCYSQASSVPKEVGCMYAPLNRNSLPMGDELARALTERLKELDALPHIGDAIEMQNALHDAHKVRFVVGNPNGHYFTVPLNRLPRYESRRR